MYNVFEKYAPRYQNIVRRYARHVWSNTVTDQTEHDFFINVLDFQNKYKRSLLQFYKKESIKIYPGTINVKSDQWLLDQMTLIENINTIALSKKDEIKLSLTEQLKKSTDLDKGFVQQVIDDLYLTPSQQKTQSVYKVYSFDKHLKAKANQLGEQKAFEYGAEINNAVLSDNFDAYDWNTQGDNKVRRTHKKLNRKTFLYIDPPTTVDEYGNIHTGNCGSDYGCRCFASKPTKKPLRNYIAYAFRKSA